MPDKKLSEYESFDHPAVRPYLIVGDAAAAIEFYCRVFAAEEIERHTTPRGGIGHAKLRLGETIVELGEHPDAVGRDAERLPRVGLRLYLPDVDATYARAISAGATGDPPSDRPQQGVRGATVHDPFGLTWWLAGRLA
ncbi:MAG: VOC family protein [Candidatus Binatia bacterium]